MLCVLTGVMVVAPAHALGQANRAELTVFGGYTIGGSLTVFEGELKIPDATSYGASLDIAVRPGGFAQILWSQQPSQLTLRRNIGGTETLTDMTTRYFQIGGMQELGQGRARPYAGMTLGLTQFDPVDSSLDGTWRFSGAPVLGLKVAATKRIGLKGHSRLWLTLIPEAGAISCGGGGCFTAIAGSVVVQLEFSGGVYLAF
jgi:hypothetical protein